MTDAIPQPHALRLQLAMIAGPGVSPEGFIEARVKRPTGMQQIFEPAGDPATRDRLAEQILKMGATTDVYVGCAPRSRRAGTADAVERVCVLWADVDGPDALARLRAFRPLPTMVIRSGSPDSAHSYWGLREPLTGEQAERACRRLAHHLGADMRATDAARILRPAGTLNHKHEPAALVECVHVDATVCMAREIVGDLPDPPTAGGTKSPAGGRFQPRRVDGSSPILTLAPADYVAALTGREPNRADMVRCPFHKGGEERTPSLRVYPSTEQGWHCFGCGAAGTIIDLGARLWGIEPRGRGYHEIIERLEAELGTRAAA
jgi:hypothetical protein